MKFARVRKNKRLSSDKGFAPIRRARWHPVWPLLLPSAEPRPPLSRSPGAPEEAEPYGRGPAATAAPSRAPPAGQGVQHRAGALRGEGPAGEGGWEEPCLEPSSAGEAAAQPLTSSQAPRAEENRPAAASAEGKGRELGRVLSRPGAATPNPAPAPAAAPGALMAAAARAARAGGSSRCPAQPRPRLAPPAALSAPVVLSAPSGDRRGKGFTKSLSALTAQERNSEGKEGPEAEYVGLKPGCSLPTHPLCRPGPYPIRGGAAGWGPCLTLTECPLLGDEARETTSIRPALSKVKRIYALAGLGAEVQLQVVLVLLRREGAGGGGGGGRRLWASSQVLRGWSLISQQVWASAAAVVSVFEESKPLSWALRGVRGMCGWGCFLTSGISVWKW